MKSCPLAMPLFAATLTISNVFARDVAPEYWIEDLTATDGSVQKCLVFQTVAGVNYRVEASNDLLEWEDESELYGLGHEYVVPVLEVAPPDPGDPPPGGAASQLVSIRMQEGSGPTGGLVLSWLSLDNKTPIVVRIAGSASSEWDQIPLVAQAYGDYQFFIWNPGTTVTPPASNPTLGPQDAAMLEEFEDNLDDLNLKVETSAADARNLPPPSPPSPDSRRFWRVRADWSMDSDLDGSPDWAEFEMAGDPSHPSSGLGDPFNGDANNDGNPDQLDNDRDGIADGTDADMDSDYINWAKTGEPRFAWFEFEPPLSRSGSPMGPLQVTNLGYAVFPDGLWSAGAYAPVSYGGNGISSCRIQAMNDLFGGQIVGDGDWDENGDGTTDQYCHVFWGGPAGIPQPIREGDNFATNRFPGISNAGGFLSYDGGFITNQSAGEDPVRWLLPTVQGSSAGITPVEEWVTSTHGPDILWGANQASINGNLTTMPHYYSNLVPTPGNTIIACGPTDRPAIYKNNGWQEASKLPHLMEFSSKGFGATFYPVQVWSNGRTMPLQTAAPGLANNWASKARLVDMSTEGNILVARDASTSEGADAYALGVPIVVVDDVEATGVDATSITSSSPGEGIDDKIWIMAPGATPPGSTVVGNDENFVRLRSTAAPVSCPLEIEASSTTFSPDSLANPDTLVTVTAGAGVTSGDHDLKITNGSAESSTSPLGVKVMKKRIVRVSVYPVSLLFEGGPLTQGPDFSLENDDLKIALGKVFEKQVNAIVLTKKEDPIVKNWDSNGDIIFQANPQTGNSPEQAIILDNLPTSTFAPHISVFVIGGPNPTANNDRFGLINGNLNANTMPDQRRIWISGSERNGQRTQAEFERTLAHEIGHALLDWERSNDPHFGHPDHGGGVAPLPGTDRTRRLMVSGEGKGDTPGHLLVKGEWDRIEMWMKENVDE